MAQLVSFKSLQSDTTKEDNDETTINDSELSIHSGPSVAVVLSDQVQNSYQTTPTTAIRNKQLEKISTISKLSSDVNSNRHFEIRWRNINLRTVNKRNRMQEFLRGSPIEDDSPFQNSNARQILTDLSGSVYSGQLTAILGPSGVGKTTLLNCLTGRNTLEGTGKVNVIGGISKRIAVCTLPQDDILPSELSVAEDLYFTSQIKNPQRGFDHNKNVARVTRLLQIEKGFDTRIGKLSGGETRRLSVARELLSNPDIMILDEPTSGLDANSCRKIISAMKSLVEHSDNELDRPVAMIVTIHQPQRELLDLFHRIYVMAQGGHAIYEGPASGLMNVLISKTNILKKVNSVDELNENPAVIAIEVASGEYGEDVIMDLADYHTSQLLEQYEEYASLSGSVDATPKSLHGRRPSPLSVSPRFLQLRSNSASPFNNMEKSALQNSDQISAVTVFSTLSQDEDLPPSYSKVKVDRRLRRSVILKSHFWRHTLILMRRSWLLTIRNLTLMSIRVIGFTLVGMGIVQIFAGALTNDNLCPNFYTLVDDIGEFIKQSLSRLTNDVLEYNIQNRSTHLFFFHIVLCMMMVTSALSGLIFPLQMRMFLRESKNGWYSLGSFLMSGTLAELPIDLIGPIITISIVYPLCHQPSSYLEWRFFGYVLVCTLASLSCKSQAQIVGGLLMNSLENSVFVSCVMVAPQALLSGIALRIKDMYYPLQLLSYGSFLRYTFECLFILRYGYGQCPCDPEQVDGFPARPSNVAIPPQLENLARGLIDLSYPSNISEIDYGKNASITSTNEAELSPNLFTYMVDLVSRANNMMVSDVSHLGSCDKYRSLFLVDRQVEDIDLIPWIIILIAIFVISRFLTYFMLLIIMKYQP